MTLTCTHCSAPDPNGMRAKAYTCGKCAKYEFIARALHHLDFTRPWDEYDDVYKNKLREKARRFQVEGYAVVPLEPTEAMLNALMCDWDSTGGRTITDNYKAMIAASNEGGA